jgi:hypothetical protein
VASAGKVVLAERLGSPTPTLKEVTMRIAIVASPWVAVPPAGYGGSEATLDTLARGLKPGTTERHLAIDSRALNQLR